MIESIVFGFLAGFLLGSTVTSAVISRILREHGVIASQTEFLAWYKKRKAAGK